MSANGLLSLILVLFGFGFTQNLSGQVSSCNYLVWEDDFDYNGDPDTAKWGYDTGGGGWGNQELQTYTDNRANSWVEDGKLIIKAIKSGNNWSSARIVSKDKGDWLYGRIEVKAKLPSGKGTWPAIWMLPTDWEYGGWPSSGEIDIMEHVGYDQGKIHGTIHTEAYNHGSNTQKGNTISFTDVSSNFHVYAIEWTETEIKWFVDGQEYFSFSNENKTYKEWPFDKRFHLLLNIAIGGSWGGAQGIDPNLTEATMEMDYVRIYRSALPDPTIQGSRLNETDLQQTYSTNSYDDFSYKWILPEGVAVLDGQGTNEINVIWNDQPGEILLDLISACDTFSADTFHVEHYFRPEEDELQLPSFDDENKLCWQALAGDGNTIELTGEDQELIVDFDISSPSQNPSIIYELVDVIDFSILNELTFDLSIDPSNSPSNIRIELEDVNGNVDLNDLFKIDDFASDNDEHFFSYSFKTDNEGTSFAIDKVKKIRLYFNYGVLGKSGSGVFTLKNLRMQVPNVTTVNDLNQVSHFAVFPNPTNGSISIQSKEKIDLVRIYSPSGILIFTKQYPSLHLCSLSLNQLNKGIYFIRLNESSAKKLSIY